MISKKELPIKTITYYDELNDDFSLPNKKPPIIDEKYKYIHKNIFWHILRFVVYRCLAMPAGFILLKFKLKHKICNRKVLKQARNTGYFLYANHTQEVGDAFIPTFVSIPKSTYVIVHPNNLLLPVLGKCLPLLGGIPLPDTFGAMKNFKSSIEEHIKNKKCITIYPEAHVWNYYTKIRNFSSTSFRYPIELNKPSFCITTTYQKSKFGRKPKVVTYLDGPFYPNLDLTKQEQIQDLRDRIYIAMLERSKLSNVEYVKYVKGEQKND